MTAALIGILRAADLAADLKEGLATELEADKDRRVKSARR